MENKMQKLFDEMSHIDEIDNIVEFIEKNSITPSDDQIKKELKDNKRRNTISWLEAKFKTKNEKYFKKIGKIYTTDKLVKEHFKKLYIKDPEAFKKTNYAHYVSWLKNNNK